jgi:hypothetical protein
MSKARARERAFARVMMTYRDRPEWWYRPSWIFGNMIERRARAKTDEIERRQIAKELHEHYPTRSRASCEAEAVHLQKLKRVILARGKARKDRKGRV